jgi:hypothetical protein
MSSRSRLIILGVAILVLAILILTFSYFNNAEGVRVEFSNIGNFQGKKVTIDGFLGENISLQQFLQDGTSDDSGSQYYSLYLSEKSPHKKIILVFDNYDFPYIDKGAFIRVTGKVEVNGSGDAYLHVIKIN